MTLEEKVAQLEVVWTGKTGIFDANDQFDAAKMAKVYPDGIGGVARPSDAHGPLSPRELPWRDVAQTLRLVNALPKWAPTNTRPGSPLPFHQDGLPRQAAPART